MSLKKSVIEITWTGPYGWPGFEMESSLPPIPKLPGVYLQTVKYKNGYLIYAAGLTRRPIPVRFREHTHQYMTGNYNVLDISRMHRGVRKVIWHGWGWSPKKRAALEKKKPMILSAVRK
jgi:hypothetical protein